MARFVKRGNSWQYEISYKSKDGKYKKMRKSGFRTKSDAKAEATEMESQLNKGYDPDKKNITIYEYYKNWINLYKKGSVSDVTYRRYLDNLSNIKKYMPFDTLADMTKQKYQEVLNEFAKTHAKATTKRFHTHVRSAILDALDEKIIFTDFTRNPVIKGEKEGKKKEEKYLNYEDFKRLMRATESRLDVRYTSPYLIIIGGATGARFAELLGLTWNDINFEEQTIDINKTWLLHKGFGPTKNESSVRRIDIDEHTVNILKEYKQKQLELLKQMNIKNQHNLVFYNPLNGMITSNAVNKTLKKIQKQLSIDPAITFHGLRHTNASVLLYEGIDLLYVSEHLGHKDISITQEVYSHVLDELKQKNKPKVSAVLSSIYN